MDPKVLAGIVNTSTGRCWSSDTYNPCPGVMEGVPSSRNYEGGFGTTLMAKVGKRGAKGAKGEGREERKERKHTHTRTHTHTHTRTHAHTHTPHATSLSRPLSTSLSPRVRTLALQLMLQARASLLCHLARLRAKSTGSCPCKSMQERISPPCSSSSLVKASRSKHASSTAMHLSCSLTSRHTQ